MDANRRLKLILVFFFFLAVLQAAYYYPKLPHEVAIHYGANGAPNNFSSKNVAVALNMLLFGVFSVIFYGLSWLVKKVPDNLINIPHKNFWLSAENKPRAIELIGGFGLKMGIVTQLFLLMLLQQIYARNIEKTNLNSHYFWCGLMIYLIVVFYLVWHFYQIFQHRKISN